MAENTFTVNGMPITPQDSGTSEAQITPLPQDQAGPDMPEAQLEPTTVLQVDRSEFPPEWAMKLQADLTALRQQLRRSQAKPPAWFKQAVARLPEEAAKRIDLAAQLRQLEQQTQKAGETQTQAIITAITRAMTAASKGVAAQLGKQLKDLDRRIKDVEKMLGQIQRKKK